MCSEITLWLKILPGQKTRLTHYQNFADIVPPQEKLDRREAGEEVLDVPVGENPLQAEVRARRQLDRVILQDMVAEKRSIRTCVLGVEVPQHAATGLEYAVDSFNQRFDHRFGKIVRDVPTENGVKVIFGIVEVFLEERSDIEPLHAVFVADHVALLLERAQDVFV